MSKTKLELTTLIRFGIQQLSARNGQMEFEHICRQFARSRIHLNILPATGPVQSGGDQGRDFETFHSYMAATPIAKMSFVGQFSTYPVAFACSLEKNPARKNGKIESDVKSITGCGVKVERIYFFSGEDIPVAKRHNVQTRVRQENQIDVEITDAGALSEHLTDPDLFWIASRYLDIPSDYFPIPEMSGWYSDLKAEYQVRQALTRLPTFEEFSEIKSALRYIYKDPMLKVDLPFWLVKLELYLDDKTIRPLKRKAIYEQFFAKLIGQNDTTGQEDFIRDYFSDFDDYRSPALLEDATLLLSLVKSSKRIVGHTISSMEIESWKSKLWSILKDEYSRTLDPGKKVWLAVIKGNYQFQILDNNDIGQRVSTMIKTMSKAVRYFKDAFFYPFDELSKSLNGLLDSLLEIDIDPAIMDELERFSRIIDDEVGRRFGNLQAGERLKIRAVQYFEKKRYLLALDAFHRLKLKWASADSAKGIILSAIFIAKCYQNIGMDYASRYYAFAAAGIAAKSDDLSLTKYLPQALNIAADACYASGAWLNYIDTLDMCIMSHTFATKDFEIYDESQEHYSILMHPTFIRYISERFNLDFKGLFRDRFKVWGEIGAEIEEAVNIAKPHYDKLSDCELFNTIHNQLNDRIFNDFGPQRSISFEIYGSQWIISFSNDYDTNAAAEQLVASMQILLVELHDVELYLIRSRIEIDFILKSDIEWPEHKVLSSNELTRWEIGFPLNASGIIETVKKNQSFYDAISTLILREISLLPEDKLIAQVMKRFDRNELAGRLLFSNTHQNLFKYFVSKEDFEKSDRMRLKQNSEFKNLQLKQNLELPWNNSLAPLYNRNNSLQMIRNRVAFVYPYEMTLPILRKSENFRQIIKTLRGKGWLDWHLLLAIGNIIVNYKIQKVSPFYDVKEAEAKAMSFFRKPEKEWYMPIPESILTVDSIEKYLLTLHVVTILRSFGLNFYSQTPNFQAVHEFLTNRFNYMIDGEDIKEFDVE